MMSVGVACVLDESCSSAPSVVDVVLVPVDSVAGDDSSCSSLNDDEEGSGDEEEKEEGEEAALDDELVKEPGKAVG